MNDEFDDDAFRDALGVRAGGGVDVGGARAAVVARAARTRAVRTVAAGSATALLLIVGLAVLVSRNGDEAPVATEPTLPSVEGATTLPSVTETTTAPQDASSTTEPSDTVPEATESPTTLPSTTRPSTTRPSSTDAPVVPTPSTPAPTSVAPAPNTSLAPTPSTTPSSPPSTTPSTSAPTTVATTDPPNPSDPPFTRQYDSLGGSITVNWNGTALSLLSVSPAAGFSAEIKDQSATRIRVDFDDGDDDSRIEVRADGGIVTHTIS